MSGRSRTADEPIEAAVVSHDDPHFEPRPGGKQVCICCCPACSDDSHCLCAGCSGDGLCSLPHDRTPHDGCDERYGCAAPVGDFDPDCVGPEGRGQRVVCADGQDRHPAQRLATIPLADVAELLDDPPAALCGPHRVVTAAAREPHWCTNPTCDAEPCNDLDHRESADASEAQS